MFERHTEKAMRTIFFGRYEASKRGSPDIEATHLLLGLLREDFPTIARVSGVEITPLRQALEANCTSSGQSVYADSDLPLSDACKRIMSWGAEEAERMGHKHIGPEHLLLGVLRENGPEAGVLGSFGIELAAAREAFRERIRAARESAAKLLDQVPEERLAAAARILAGLASGPFSLKGISSEGAFKYHFGHTPRGA